ncbi:hypothetical protein [Streptomyces sp. NPDC008121]|uniref:hypothetical protein n=1 Tax=Streptomyces sp. NPDC008121 TaxID=3364809 RepID=UPI0036F140D0
MFGAAVMCAGAVTFTAGPASAAPVTETFTFTGAPQQFTVPAGVTSVSVVADGAQGGQDGGLGARVTSGLAVTPGQMLDVYVGGAGGSPAGGYNGGGQGTTDPSRLSDSGGGGGASDVRPVGSGLSERLLVAAGGGGDSGADPSRADGGAADTAGSNGENGGEGVFGAEGGGPGSDPYGGTGGGLAFVDGQAGIDGTPGESGTGGNGGASQTDGPSGTNAGGGGGGGLTGGGGGGGGAVTNLGDFSGGAGGGGGSSLDPDGGAAPTAAPAGDGQVTITYDDEPAAGPADVALDLQSPASVNRNGTFTYNLVVTNAGPGTAEDISAVLGTNRYTQVQSTSPAAQTGTYRGLSGTVWKTTTDLAPGQQAVFTATVKANAPGGTNILAGAAAGSQTEEPNWRNNADAALTRVNR